MNNKLKKYIKLFLALIIIGAFYMMIECPIKFLTGVSCPGCGMTRALLSVIRFDFKNAFYYHPLWLIPIIYIVLYFYILKKNKKANNTILAIFISMFFITYFLRLLSNNTIVYIDFKESFIYNIIRLIINKY